MDFTRLPIHFSESILSHCNIQTIAKMKQTCSTMDKIIEEKQLNKMDVKRIKFTRIHNYSDTRLRVDLPNYEIISPDKGQSIERYYFIKKTWPGEEDYVETNERKANIGLHKIMHQVLSSMKSIKCVTFHRIHVGVLFEDMIKSLDVQWDKAEFVDCSFAFPTYDLHYLSTYFKSICVKQVYAKDLNEDAQYFNDTFIEHTLGKVAFDTDHFLETPNITDRTLEIFMEQRIPVINMGFLIVNFTVEGIIQFFRKMLASRYEYIDHWCIGYVNFNLAEVDRLFEEINSIKYFTEDTVMIMTSEVDSTLYKFKYNKRNSEYMAVIELNLLMPEERQNDQYMEEQEHDSDEDMYR